MREKLIEILRVPIYPHELADPAEVVADYLMDNDVVPVVRCRDCEHSREKNKQEAGYLCEGIKICCHPEASECGWNPVWPNHFCSYGERKDNG